MDKRKVDDSTPLRSHLLATAAGAAVVLAVVVPLAVASGGGDRAAPVPATETPTSWLQTIPEDFPLADGLPATNGNDGSPVTTTDTPGLDGVRLCGRTGWSVAEPVESVDVAGATYTGEAEDFRGRTLGLYPDDEAAARALDALRAAVSACPEESVGGTDQVYAEVPGPAFGDESFVLTHRYRDQGFFGVGLEVVAAVRVGNAVLLTSHAGEGGGSPATIEASIADVGSAAGGVVEQMCLFAAGGCGRP